VGRLKRILRDIDKALDSYPLLQRTEEDGCILVNGEIVLTHKDVGEYDRYSVSIRFPEDYPRCFPKVIETSDKIPKIPDRHVNVDDSLCLAVEPEERRIAKNGISFKFFLDKVLVPHLSRETHRSLSPQYEDGEYAHGQEGIWKYFEEILEISGKHELLEKLEKIVETNWPRRNDRCSCGSGKKFKKCHLLKWEEVMASGKDYLTALISKLKEEINEEN
jgi:hypothetical protein